MKLLFQWEPWAYSHMATLKIKELLNIEVEEVLGFDAFHSIWARIDAEHWGVLPIENATAWSIHENLYGFLRFWWKIVGEYTQEVDHCLWSLEHDLANVKEVYSHPQALMQCHEFIMEHGLKPIKYTDTAASAKMIAETGLRGAGAIASKIAGEIYWLHELASSIGDLAGNTTRFFLVAPEELEISFPEKKNKTTLIFEARNIPASLYKCLGAFATNGINLVKIESVPSFKSHYSYLFWLEFEGHTDLENVKKALHELSFFTEYFKVLGEY